MDKISWRGVRVLITGGTGFIGSHLVLRLIQAGAEVSLFVLDEERHIPDDVIPIYRGNIQDAPDIARAIGRSNPQFIFHLAAQPLVDTALINVYDTLDSNIRGSINLLQACVGNGKIEGIIFVSTDKVYGEFNGTVDESAPLMGIDHPYNVSKVCADNIAQMYAKVFGLPIIIARSGNVYGDGDRHWDRLIPGTFMSALKEENPKIRSNGKFTRDYIYVDDIVDAYLILADTIVWERSLRGQAINFGADKSLTVLEVAHEILKSTEKIWLVPEIQNRSKFEIPHQHLNWEWAKELGWVPKTDFVSGIELSKLWYQEYYEGKYGKR